MECHHYCYLDSNPALISALCKTFSCLSAFYGIGAKSPLLLCFRTCTRDFHVRTTPSICLLFQEFSTWQPVFVSLSLPSGITMQWYMKRELPSHHLLIYPPSQMCSRSVVSSLYICRCLHDVFRWVGFLFWQFHLQDTNPSHTYRNL